MDIRIDEIFIGNRHRKELGDLQSLAESMQRLGLLQPIVVDPKRRLIAGERRIEAAKTLGWKTIEAIVAINLKEAIELLAAEQDENTCHKHLLPSEAYEIGQQLDKLLAEQAQARIRAGAYAYGTVAMGSKGATRDKMGKTLGFSGKTYDKIKAVYKSGDPKLIRRMDYKSIDGAYKALRMKEGKDTTQPPKSRQQRFCDDIRGYKTFTQGWKRTKEELIALGYGAAVKELERLEGKE